MSKQNFQNTIFTTPIWIFDMPEHNSCKDIFLKTVDSYIEKNSLRENIYSSLSLRTVSNIHHNTYLQPLTEVILNLAPIIKQDFHLEEKHGIAVREMWATKTQPSGVETIDPTFGGLVSGLFFVDTPPGSGDLIIENPIGQTDYFTFSSLENSGFNQPTHKLKIPEGKIFLFPSYLQHKLTANETKDSSRTIIHFTLCAV